MDPIPRMSQKVSQRQSHFQILDLNTNRQISLLHTHDSIQNLPKLGIVCTLLVISSFYYGFSLTYLSTVSNTTLENMYGPNIIKATIKSVLTGLVPIGAIFGSLIANRLMQVLTRRNFMIITNICALIINIIIQANNIYVLFVCRLLSGIFVGMYLGIVPIYVHELCPHSVAGSFGAFTQLAHILGVVICYLFGMIFYLAGDTSDFTLRFQLQFTSILIILQTFMMLINYIPESPNSLLQRSMVKQAKQVLMIFHANQEYVDQLIQQKRLQNEDLDKNESININDTLAVDKIRLTWKAALLGFELPFMQQMSGVNFLVTQVGTITGAFDPSVEPYSALMANTIQFIATACSVFVLSRIGRKPLLQYGNLGIGIINIILGILFFFINQWKPAFPFSLVMISIFMIWYGLTIGPVVWLYVPQILPTNMVPIATIMNWVGCSLCVIVCPIVSSAMGNNPYLVFLFLGGLQLLFFIPNILFVVETKGLAPFQINPKLQ